ncbi:MAG: zinc ribbon domain-containing protein [Deltaproteobacteria bacterium]|nr:zinc ribbon domain-containing protein [Deltaproteobacteria bacterium]
MALIKCPECQAEVSDKAPQCIKCGAPLVLSNIEERGWFQKQLSPKIRCTSCGYTGKPARVGWDFSSLLIAIILLLCFIIPGIIYIIWRDGQAGQLCCRKCKNKQIVKI